MLRARLSISNQKRFINYFKLFPKTFPQAHETDFDIDLGNLRKEYIQLQRQVHPDVAHNTNHQQQQQQPTEVTSAEISNAYRELKDPFKRARHILTLYNQNPFEEVMDQNMELVMRVMELQEDVTLCSSVDQLDDISRSVDSTIADLSKQMAELLRNKKFVEAKPILQELQYMSKVMNSIEAQYKKLGK